MLKEKIKTGKPILVGSIWDPLSARIYQKAGFDALNVGSYTVAASFGFPDVGLITWLDYLEITRKVTSFSNLPVMIDGEQGFGHKNLTVYTFGEFERVGASAMRIDDKAGTVKCPYLGTPDVSPVEETVDKIRAVVQSRKSDDFMIIARSSAAHKYGFNESLERLKAFRDAGADVLWPSTWSMQDLELSKKTFPDVPLCVSLTPFSVKKYTGLTVRQAVDMGYQLIFFSSTIFFAGLKRSLEAATSIVQKGDPKQLWPDEYWDEQFLELVEFTKWTKPAV
ncbi:isocitrate lyase/PEP mutase family protein [Thermodesulfobacteriota bacterium]